MVEPNAHLPENLTSSKKSESPLVLIFSGIVIALIAVALWISINSIFEKIRISQGLQQITTIVALARDSARTDSHFALDDRKDLLEALERSGRLRTDGIVDGVKVLHNPWKNILVGLINPNGNIRVETVVPPHICQRFIGSFGQNLQSFGIKQIDIKGSDSSWRQVYNGAVDGKINEITIAAGCGDTVQSDVALTFSLH
jgi:hypothetical protein